MLRSLGTWEPQGPRLARHCSPNEHEEYRQYVDVTGEPHATSTTTTAPAGQQADWVALASPPRAEYHSAASSGERATSRSSALTFDLVDADVDEELSVVGDGRVLVWSAGGAIRRTFDISHTNVARGVAAASGWCISDVDFRMVGSWNGTSFPISQEAVVGQCPRVLCMVIARHDQRDLETSASLSMLLDPLSSTASMLNSTTGLSLLMRQTSRAADGMAAERPGSAGSPLAETLLSPRLLVFDIAGGDDHEVVLPAGTRKVTSIRVGSFAHHDSAVSRVAEQWALLLQPIIQPGNLGFATGARCLFHPLDDCVPLETFDYDTKMFTPLDSMQEVVFAHSPRHGEERSWVVTFDHRARSHAVWLATHAPPAIPRSYQEAARLGRTTNSVITGEPSRAATNSFTPAPRRAPDLTDTSTHSTWTARQASRDVLSAPRSTSVPTRVTRFDQTHSSRRRLVLCPLLCNGALPSTAEPACVFVAHGIDDEPLLVVFDSPTFQVCILRQESALELRVLTRLHNVVSCAPICATRPAALQLFDILCLTFEQCLLFVGGAHLCSFALPHLWPPQHVRLRYSVADRVTLVHEHYPAIRVQVCVRPRTSLVSDCCRALICDRVGEESALLSKVSALRIIGQLCERLAKSASTTMHDEFAVFADVLTSFMSLVGEKSVDKSASNASQHQGHTTNAYEKLFETATHERFSGQTKSTFVFRTLEAPSGVLDTVAVVQALHMLYESYLICPLAATNATCLAEFLYAVCMSDERLLSAAPFYHAHMQSFLGQVTLGSDLEKHQVFRPQTIQEFVMACFLVPGAHDFEKSFATGGPVPWTLNLHRVVLRCFQAFFRGDCYRYASQSKRTAFFALDHERLPFLSSSDAVASAVNPPSRVAAILFDEGLRDEALDSLVVSLGQLLRECSFASFFTARSSLPDSVIRAAAPLITFLLFDAKDDRLDEAIRLLRADQPTDLTVCVQVAGQDDHAFANAQQRHLYSVATSRKLSLGVGRGLMDCGCVWTLRSKDGGERTSNAISYTMLELDIPPIVLSGRTVQSVASSITAVDGTSSSIARELIVALADLRENPSPCASMISTLWPRFHNGVASGMRLLNSLDQEAKAGAVEWLLFNRTVAAERMQREARAAAQATIHGNAQAQVQAQMLMAHRGDVVSELEHAGVLFAMGLCGLLVDFPLTRVFSYLSQAHEATSVGLLLGLSASHRGTQSQSIARVLSVHTPMIAATSELDLPINVQAAALFGLGILYEGSRHRRTVITLLNGLIGAAAAGNQRATTVSIAGASSSSAASFASQTGAGTLGSNNTYNLLQGGTSGRRSLSLSCGLALGLTLHDESRQSFESSTRIADLDLVPGLLALVDACLIDSFVDLMTQPNSSGAGESSQEALLVLNNALLGGSTARAVSHVLDVDVVVPSALACLGIAFCHTKNPCVVKALRLPEAFEEFGASPSLSRPPFLLIRAMSLGLVDWSPSSATVYDQAWLTSFLPKFLSADLQAISDREKASYLVACRDYAETGILLALSFNFAGTQDARVRNFILQKLDYFIELAEKDRPTARKMVGTRIAAERRAAAGEQVSEEIILDRQTTWEPPVCHRYDHCAAVLAIAAACVFAGSGDLILFKRLRRLSLRVFIKDSHTHSPTTTYGYHQAVSSALGLLVLGRGQLTLRNDSRSIGYLVASLFPLFPAHTADNSGHLQALRHLYCFATTNRTAAVFDSETFRPVPCPIDVEVSDGTSTSVLHMMSPCILPPRGQLRRISIASDRYSAPAWVEGSTTLFRADERITLKAKLRAGALSYAIDPVGKKDIAQRPWPRFLRARDARKVSSSTLTQPNPFLGIVRDYARTQPGLAWFAAYFCGLDEASRGGESKAAGDRLEFCSQALYECLVQDKPSVLGILLELNERLRLLRLRSDNRLPSRMSQLTPLLLSDTACLVALYKHPLFRPHAKLLNSNLIAELESVMLGRLCSPEIAAKRIEYAADPLNSIAPQRSNVHHALAKLPESLRSPLFADLCLTNAA